MGNFRDELCDIVVNPMLSDDMIENRVLQLIYNRNKSNTLNLFLDIQRMELERINAEQRVLYRGVESGMHGMAQLAQLLLEGKTSNKSKKMAKYIFSNMGLPSIIDICKAYFPEGNAKGCSESGKWFFNKFVKNLIKHKDNYMEGGEDHFWCVSHGHIQYFKLVLSQHEKNN